MSTTRFASPKAPVTDPALSRAGLLICCHGVHGGAGSAAQHAAAIQRRGIFAETRVCCLKGQPALAGVVDHMESPEIYLVPLLMAEGYTAGRIMSRALRDVAKAARRIVVCRPVGANPRMVEVLSASARQCCHAKGWAREKATVIVMGHGTTRCASSGGTLLAHVRALAHQGDFAAAVPAFLDQTPSLEQALEGSTTPHTVVVGLFADRGSHGENDVPRLLAMSGHPAAYAGPVGTAPELSDLILDQVLARAASDQTDSPSAIRLIG